MRSHATLVAGLLALVVSGLSCHAGDLLNSTTTGKPPVAARQLMFTTQPGSVAPGAPVPTVRVSALDSSGALAQAFSGAITVSLATNPGSGTLTGTLSETAVNGVATFADLAIDKSGTGYTLRAVASGLSEATSQAFDVTTTQPPPPPPATQLRFTVQPTTTQAGQTISPAVQVTALDASGAVVPSFTGAITVAIGTNPAGGTLSGTRTVNASGGVASFTGLTIDKAGSGYTLKATSSGLTNATSSSFDITATPPPPPPPATQLRFTVQPQATQAGQTITPPVQVSALDASGALVTSFSGTITVAIGTNPAGGTLSGTRTVNAVNGVATFANLSINNAGTGYTLQATSSGLTSATSSAFNVTAAPPPPATQLRFTVQPASTQAGQAIAPPVQVSALDASGTVVTSFAGAITVAIGTNPAAGTLSGTLTVNAANGVATFSDLSINNAGSGYILQATSSGLTSATSATFNITAPPPPAATQLRFTVQPQSTQAGLAISPPIQVSALDASGSIVTTFSSAITMAIGTNPAAGTLSGTLTVNATNGVATFSDLSINNAGTGYTLQATSSGLTSATSATFNITAPPPPPATQLSFTVQPTNTLPSGTITPAVEVTALDAQGNPVSGFTGTITIAIGHDASLLGNAVLSGTLTVTAVSGVARFSNLSIDQIGVGYTLRATATGLTSAESATFNIGP